MVVFENKIERGKKYFFTKSVGQLAHKADIKIPVIVLAGTSDGPTLWVNGTVHGDELNGSFAAWELVRELSVEDIKGTIIVTPICNPIAFEHRDKVSAIDGMDMDTAFPGDPEGMLTQRIAYFIYKEIKRNANALISFHTLATPYQANPYTVSKVVPGVEEHVTNKARELAFAFGVEVNCTVDLSKATGELPGVTSGALDITCMNDGIPAFMAEVGHGGIIEDEYVTVSKTGIKNVLAALQMFAWKIEKPEKQYIIKKRKFLRIDQGGLITMKVKPGDQIKSGTPLLDVHYYGEDRTPFPVKQDSFVICTRLNPVVNTGDRIAFVGTEWEVI